MTKELFKHTPPQNIGVNVYPPHQTDLGNHLPPKQVPGSFMYGSQEFPFNPNIDLETALRLLLVTTVLAMGTSCAFAPEKAPATQTDLLIDDLSIQAQQDILTQHNLHDLVPTTLSGPILETPIAPTREQLSSDDPWPGSEDQSPLFLAKYLFDPATGKIRDEALTVGLIPVVIGATVSPIPGDEVAAGALLFRTATGTIGTIAFYKANQALLEEFNIPGRLAEGVTLTINQLQDDAKLLDQLAIEASQVLASEADDASQAVNEFVVGKNEAGEEVTAGEQLPETVSSGLEDLPPGFSETLASLDDLPNVDLMHAELNQNGDLILTIDNIANLNDLPELQDQIVSDLVDNSPLLQKFIENNRIMMAVDLNHLVDEILDSGVEKLDESVEYESVELIPIRTDSGVVVVAGWHLTKKHTGEVSGYINIHDVDTTHHMSVAVEGGELTLAMQTKIGKVYHDDMRALDFVTTMLTDVIGTQHINQITGVWSPGTTQALKFSEEYLELRNHYSHDEAIELALMSENNFLPKIVRLVFQDDPSFIYYVVENLPGVLTQVNVEYNR